MGFGPPSRYFPISPPAVSRPKAPLLGFCAPSTLKEEGIHVSCGCPLELPRCPGFRRQLPRCRLRCRSQVFPTSQRLPSSLRPPAIFRQVAFLGFCPSGVCFLSRRPGGSSPPACPHDVSPAGCASPSPRQGSQQARQPLPRMKRLSSFFVFRASVRGRIGLSPSSHD
jgi:hypothetical protein